MHATYLFTQVDLLLAGALRGLLLGALGPLDLALVEARQVLVPGVGVELDLLDGVGGLSHLRRRASSQGAFLGPWTGEHCWKGAFFSFLSLALGFSFLAFVEGFKIAAVPYRKFLYVCP